MDIKEDDFNQIQGWMLRITLKDADGNERRLTLKELLIFAKVYGFVQDDQGICRCREEYLQIWGNADRKTVYTALKAFEQNDFIKITRMYDRRVKKTKNVYVINKEKITNIIKNDNSENKIVLATSSITIPKNQLKYNFSAAKMIVYALISQYSKDGNGTCKPSKEYIAEWLADSSHRTVCRILDSLCADNLIKANRTDKSPSGWEYWTTESRLNNGQNSPLPPADEIDKIPHCSGQNSPSVLTKFPITHDKIPHLNLSINSSEKEVEEKCENTAATPTNYNKYFINTIYSNLDKDAVFIKKLETFISDNSLSDEKLGAYIADTFERLKQKKNQTVGLFITMLFSVNDFSVFSEKYEKQLAAKKAEEERIKRNTVVCPVCGKHFLKNQGFGRCSCGLEENELNNSERIEELKKYNALSPEEKAAYDEKEREAASKLLWSFLPGKETA